MRVLLVEDDLVNVRRISLELKAAHVFIDQANKGSEAVEMVRHYEYDVVLVGLTLSDMDGRHVVRLIRAEKRMVPILVLGSGHTVASAEVEAFGAGADDFLTMPMHQDELMPRIQTVMRRSRSFSDPTIRVGAVELNTNTQQVSYAGNEVCLTGKEYAMIELLMLRKGQVLTKDAFLNHLYGGMDEPEGKIIDVFICKLRKKLLAVGGSDVITTVWGQGVVLKERAEVPVAV